MASPLHTFAWRLALGALAWGAFLTVCLLTAGCAGVHPGTDAAGNRVLVLGNPSCIAFCVITLDKSQ